MTDAPASTDAPEGSATPIGDQPAGTGAAMAADLPAKAADAVELLVDSVFDKVIRPLLIAARAIVFGLVAAVVLLMVLVLLSIGLVRFLDVYAFGGRVWISYLVIGGLFTLLGGLAWSQRSPRSAANG